MISDRSLSDRLWNGHPRRQTVLGFNISLDPPAYTTDSAAVVEISVSEQIERRRCVMVAMMPQETTYNAGEAIW